MKLQMLMVAVLTLAPISTVLAAQTSGTITAISKNADTITLSDGKTYKLPEGIEDTKLRVGSEMVLIRSNGDPVGVARAARSAVGGLPGLKVSQIGDAVALIGSSLTAVDLAGLTRLELIFALVMLAASGGLVLGLGLADRERSFALLVALGARPRQLGAFVWSEAALVVVGGMVLGLMAGALIAYVLVKLLTGVFDPPPEALSVPWSYLAALVVTATAAAFLAATVEAIRSRTHVIEKLRAD